jgi:hypothetical protein
VSTLAELRDDPRVRSALAKAVEWAEACDAAAQLLIAESDSEPLSFEVAMAAGMAAQAWAAVHAATRPNGAVP